MQNNRRDIGFQRNNQDPKPLTGSNLLSVKNYGEFEFWLALCKVVAILAFIVLGGDQHRAEHRAEAVGHKAAVIPQPRNAAHLGIGIKSKTTANSSSGWRCAKWSLFWRLSYWARSPLPVFIPFAVVFDAQQVTAGEGEGDDQGEQPHRDARHP
jgi:hypothetical protein